MYKKLTKSIQLFRWNFEAKNRKTFFWEKIFGNIFEIFLGPKLNCRANWIFYISYETIFGPTFSVKFRNYLPKTVILSQNGHLLHVSPSLGKMRIFLEKSGHAIFLHLLYPNFMPSFRKIVRVVSEISSWHPYIHIHWHKHLHWQLLLIQ